MFIRNSRFWSRWKKASEPRPLIPARLRKLAPAASADDFLDAREGEEAAHRGLLAGGEDAHAGLARAQRHRRGAEHHRRDHDPGRLADAFVRSDDVTAGDVAELVGDHALHLVGIVGDGDQAGMKIDDLAAGDEGVDLAVLDQDDLDIARARAAAASISGRAMSRSRASVSASRRIVCAAAGWTAAKQAAISISSRAISQPGRRVLMEASAMVRLFRRIA